MLVCFFVCFFVSFFLVLVVVDCRLFVGGWLKKHAGSEAFADGSGYMAFPSCASVLCGCCLAHQCGKPEMVLGHVCETKAGRTKCQGTSHQPEFVVLMAGGDLMS